MWRLKIAEGGNDLYLYSTNNFVGRQIWEFDPNYGTEEEREEVELARLHFWNLRHGVKASSDILWRMQFLREKQFKQTIPQVKIEEGEEISYEKVSTTLRRSVQLFAALQADDGHWPAENAGPMYFMPPLVLGVREWIGSNPMPPEFWILPPFLPIHPAKMWCFCRLVYMPMSYLYGRRFVGPITPLVLQLREELYVQPYNEIKWKSSRHLCAKEDLYYPSPLLQDLMWDALYIFTEPLLTRWPFSKLREQALKTTMKHIHYEDENSRYITLGSVEKALCMLACWVEDPTGVYFKKHLARIPDYIWIAEDGLKIQSFGSQEWDASLAIQALLATNIGQEIDPKLKKGHDFIKASQVSKLIR